ncbi:MAG TPA: LysR family transcriptional regulator [Polyangia bacterium]|jgi:DNA-binding transcriptional LysR family regulator
MEMNQVRYFLAVCETKNFTRAAGRCRVSQPALTTSIKKLEDELGGALFFRDRAGVTLTALGRSLYPRFQRLSAESASIGVVADNHRRLKQVPLRLGVLATIGPARVARYLEAFRGRAPGVELELHVGRQDELLAKLEELDLDVVMTNVGDVAPDWAVVGALYEESYTVLLPPGHALGGRVSIRLADLAGQPYVDRLACEMRETVAAACAAKRFELYATHRTEREEWVQAFVQAGLGFAFLPEFSVLPGETVARPLIEPTLRRTISAVRNADRPLAAAAKLFWSQLVGKS